MRSFRAVFPAACSAAFFRIMRGCLGQRAARPEAIVFAPGRVRLTGCVLSDIVKRRSLRALLWMKIQSGAQSPCTRAWARHRSYSCASATLRMPRSRAVQICRWRLTALPLERSRSKLVFLSSRYQESVVGNRKRSRMSDISLE
jgi:hypothetical protein